MFTRILSVMLAGALFVAAPVSAKETNDTTLDKLFSANVVEMVKNIYEHAKERAGKQATATHSDQASQKSKDAKDKG